jgi:hypothetical protein
VVEHVMDLLCTCAAQIHAAVGQFVMGASNKHRKLSSLKPGRTGHFSVGACGEPLNIYPSSNRLGSVS